MIKNIPKTNWAEYLLDFAKDNEGKKVKLFGQDNDGIRLIGRDRLIAFEGECDGNMIHIIKIVVGAEGEKPENVFHYVQSPLSLKVEENDANGETQKIYLEDSDHKKTILEVEE